MELTGYASKDLIMNNKKSFNDIIHPDDRENVWNIIQAALKEKYVWEQGRGIFSKNGDLMSLEGFITDMSDRKKAEVEIKKSLKEKKNPIT